MFEGNWNANFSDPCRPITNKHIHLATVGEQQLMTRRFMIQLLNWINLSFEIKAESKCYHNERAGGDSPVSQVPHIVMTHCAHSTGMTAIALFCLLSASEGSTDELFFCSLAQHDTLSSPDGPHRDGVHHHVCCWAACVGQCNITHTIGAVWLSRKEKNTAATSTEQNFVPTPKASCF